MVGDKHRRFRDRLLSWPCRNKYSRRTQIGDLEVRQLIDPKHRLGLHFGTRDSYSHFEGKEQPTADMKWVQFTGLMPWGDSNVLLAPAVPVEIVYEVSIVITSVDVMACPNICVLLRVSIWSDLRPSDLSADLPCAEFCGSPLQVTEKPHAPSRCYRRPSIPVLSLTYATPSFF